MSTESFFKDIESFDNFSGITETKHFRSAPKDWYVVVTDVVGSTEAIERGHYKDVNTIGAASIACAHNAMPGIEFPFTFGGDGASFLIPASRREAVAAELMALQALSENRFQLELRVCIIRVSELYEQGARLEVAKFQEPLGAAKFPMTGGKRVGMFRGGGLTLAEKILKAPGNPYSLTSDNRLTPDLDDLSCRWKPIPNRHGKIVSLMVVSTVSDQPESYRQVLNKLEEIVGGPLESVNPVDQSVMSYRGFWQCVNDEIRYFDSGFSRAFLKKMLGILISVLSFRYYIPVMFDPGKYINAIPHHSDYRKFDDSLRMIIDCSVEQVKAITTYLEDRHQAGELFFGMHLSEESLMTCYVQSVEAADHIHFIDGGDGGYAAASKQLKQQATAAAAMSQ